MAAPRSISIVIEWENAIVADRSRPVRMLERMQHDILLAGAELELEIISGFDPNEIDTDFVQTMLVEGLRNVPWVTLRYLSLSGMDYYAMKNLCAAESRGEVVILLDSDVIPAPGWLHKIVDTFGDQEIQICASSVYLAKDSLVEKTLALIWIFELPPNRSGVEKTRSIWVNSTAYRREVLLKFPLPPSAGTARASCAAHVRELRAAGVPMHRRIDALVEHPAPIGIREFIVRALARGRDKVLGSPKPFWRNVAFDIKRGVGLISKRRSDVGIRNVEVPLALGIASAWWLLMVVGGVAAMIAPMTMRNRLQM